MELYQPGGETDTTSTQSRGLLAVVIVTYNRCADLSVTLDALFGMTQEFASLIVVDNASSDGTEQLLIENKLRFGGKLTICRSEKNLGGAGGFHLGMKTAIDLPVDWIWVSDDDAVPRPGCLSNLLKRAGSSENVYGGVAVIKNSAEEELCWPAPVIPGKGRAPFQFKKTRGELAETQEVLLLPFLGFMINKQKVAQIGLPDSSYFISGDDAQYCIRARSSGSKLIQVRDSVVVHPRISRYVVKVLGKEFYCLTMQPWRRYYEVRNRIWNARLADGGVGAFMSTMTHVLRLVFTFMYEDDLAGQPGAYFRGIRDGLLTHPAGNSTKLRPT